MLNVNHRAVQLELRRRGDDRVAVRENSNDIGGRQDFPIELLSGVVQQILVHTAFGAIKKPTTHQQTLRGSQRHGKISADKLGNITG